ncbi:hypothetical protein B0A48_06071 [Cryoendolithus antarcticus]|uniref:U6 snRNA-associated Sm-like protein LSm1 n=1 Tax=Cryoendolithus antarcticus TaxID=1507870 RepID=A0A1V8TCT1_9PEZI|nr:hypothetical protein B0A48_06071 [Cryoendolithus antarcticus]
MAPRSAIFYSALLFSTTAFAAQFSNTTTTAQFIGSAKGSPIEEATQTSLEVPSTSPAETVITTTYSEPAAVSATLSTSSTSPTSYVPTTSPLTTTTTPVTTPDTTYISPTTTPVTTTTTPVTTPETSYPPPTTTPTTTTTPVTSAATTPVTTPETYIPPTTTPPSSSSTTTLAVVSSPIIATSETSLAVPTTEASQTSLQVPTTTPAFTYKPDTSSIETAPTTAATTAATSAGNTEKPFTYVPATSTSTAATSGTASVENPPIEYTYASSVSTPSNGPSTTAAATAQTSNGIVIIPASSNTDTSLSALTTHTLSNGIMFAPTSSAPSPYAPGAASTHTLSNGIAFAPTSTAASSGLLTISMIPSGSNSGALVYGSQTLTPGSTLTAPGGTRIALETISGSTAVVVAGPTTTASAFLPVRPSKTKSVTSSEASTTGMAEIIVSGHTWRASGVTLSAGAPTTMATGTKTGSGSGATIVAAASGSATPSPGLYSGGAGVNLSLHDAGPPGPPPPGQQQQQMPPPVPQLPPQMFTTAAQLLDLTDKKLMIALRDGRKLIGVLRSWDQFGNLVLQNTVERMFVQNLYADVERGLFLVRGENVTLLGEIDLDKDDYVPEPYKLAPVGEVFALKKAEDAKAKKADLSKQKKLAAIGFESEHHGEAIL